MIQKTSKHTHTHTNVYRWIDFVWKKNRQTSNLYKQECRTYCMCDIWDLMQLGFFFILFFSCDLSSVWSPPSTTTCWCWHYTYLNSTHRMEIMYEIGSKKKNLQKRRITTTRLLSSWSWLKNLLWLPYVCGHIIIIWFFLHQKFQVRIIGFSCLFFIQGGRYSSHHRLNKRLKFIRNFLCMFLM